MTAAPPSKCTWCGADAPADDHWSAYVVGGTGHARFCRLEHVVPWSIQGAKWETDPATAVDTGSAEPPTTCTQCGAGLAGPHVVLVRHRGPHRIADAFCSEAHLASWAKSGGPWAPPG